MQAIKNNHQKYTDLSTNGDNTKELALLKCKGFSAPIERGFIIHIEGFDWNCPKYITPRYTQTQIKNIIEPIQKENARLKIALAQQAQKEIATNISENSIESINQEKLFK